MRIKNQFLLSIGIFVVIIVIFAALVFATAEQTAQLNSQGEIAGDIRNHASNLVYLSSDYFLYHDSSSLAQWQIEFSSLSDSISKISVSSLEQQTLLNRIKSDAQQLNESWIAVVLYLETTPLDVTVRNIPVFQADWSIMSAQNQALIFDATQQAQAFRAQVDQLNLTTILLISSLLCLFGAYFITNYLITYRNTLKSISDLQNGLAIIGSGNLDYSLKANKKDEIGEVSNSVNQMATNLKTVTASKAELELAQASLMESEQRWATTLASIGDAVIATDTLGKIVFMNGQAEELTGWALREVSQKPVKTAFNIINEQTRLEVESPTERVLREGIIVGLANHTVLIQKGGTEIPIDDSGAPIKDKEGKTTGVVLIFRDITERKKATEATVRQAELIDLSPDAIIVKKLDGTVTFWNRGAEKLYGWTKEEAIGQDINSLLKTDFPQPLEEILSTLKSDGKWSGEVVHTCKNGSKLALQSYWLAKFGPDGKMVEVLESNVNITDRIELQLKLEEYANQMEKLAEKRAAQLKDAERLAAIGATAGMVGHDIRNPLQAITSDAFLAKTELASIPDSEEKKNALESIDEIEKNIDYINKIVQDLQDYARPLNPKIEEIDLNSIVDSFITKNGLPKNIKVNVKVTDEARKISADSYYLNRILFNLVTNAVQAMPNGGKLTIEAHKDAENTVLSVKDTGVGIPKEIQDKMFTIMFTTKSKGQGFGLPVVKRMTESLGGTVTFKSQEGKGTIFTVSLPLQRGKR